MDNSPDYKQQWFDFVDYNPHHGQQLLHNPPKGEYHPKDNPDGARFIVACCGRRFGKSYSAVQKIKKLITDFSTFSEIWGDLSTKINSNQELSLSDRTRLSDYLESIFI